MVWFIFGVDSDHVKIVDRALGHQGNQFQSLKTGVFWGSCQKYPGVFMSPILGNHR